jgi:hypothetical protein
MATAEVVEGDDGAVAAEEVVGEVVGELTDDAPTAADAIAEAASAAETDGAADSPPSAPGAKRARVRGKGPVQPVEAPPDADQVRPLPCRTRLASPGRGGSSPCRTPR